MSLVDLLLELKLPVWLTLLIAVVALLAMAVYRYLLNRRIKKLEHQLHLEATRNEKLMELVQERHRKKLDALDEVNSSLMEFDHCVDHLMVGTLAQKAYAKRLEASHDSARNLSRKYETLLGDEFYRAVLRYTDEGKRILRSSFVLTNDNLMQLEQRGIEASTLDRLRKTAGPRIPVIELRKHLLKLEAVIDAHEHLDFMSVAHIEGGFSLNNYRDAQNQYLQIKEKILHTVPPLSYESAEWSSY